MRILISALILCLPLAAAGQQPKVPADIARQIEQASKEGRTIRYHVKQQDASGVGAGGESRGEKADLKMDNSAPVVTLPGASASGGDTKASASAISSQTNWVRIILALVGVGGLAYAGFCVYRRNPRGALVAGIGGAAFVVASMLPDWAWLALAVGGIGYMVAHGWIETTHPGNIADRKARLKGKLARIEALTGLDLDGDGKVGTSP